MEIIQAFRQTFLRYAIIAIVIASGLACLFNVSVAKGLMLTGAINILLFHAYTRNLTVANPSVNGLKSHALKWQLTRFVAYLAVAYKAYQFDPEGLGGLFGALGALLLVRIVMMVIGITNVDLKKVAE